jgi:predicted ATPase
MTAEDEEFNRIEREATLRRKAVSAALKDHLTHMRQSMSEYERGVIDGMQKQMQSSVDKAVNAMAAQRKWAGLTDEDKLHIEIMGGKSDVMLAEMVEAKLKERNA